MEDLLKRRIGKFEGFLCLVVKEEDGKGSYTTMETIKQSDQTNTAEEH